VGIKFNPKPKPKPKHSPSLPLPPLLSLSLTLSPYTHKQKNKHKKNIEGFYISWKILSDMKRKTVFSLILILAFSLVLVPVVNADCVELKYDDGTVESGLGRLTGSQAGVKFTLPQNWKQAKLVMARYFIYDDPNRFEVHVYDLSNNDLIPPFTVTPTSTGWFNVPLDVVVSGDFFIALEYINVNIPLLGLDLSVNQGRSYERQSSTDPWIPYSWNQMIRAEVCEILPVGGELLPNTVSTIGTLIIAVISLIGVSIGIAYKNQKII